MKRSGGPDTLGMVFPSVEGLASFQVKQRYIFIESTQPHVGSAIFSHLVVQRAERPKLVTRLKTIC
ncbi:MAG TPA: hypothetical protein VII44_10270, partial [Puia sp.]